MGEKGHKCRLGKWDKGSTAAGCSARWHGKGMVGGGVITFKKKHVLKLPMSCFLCSTY